MKENDHYRRKQPLQYDHMWVHLDLRQRNKNYAGHINARRITFVGYHMSLKLSSNATQSCILDHMIVIIIFISCYVRFQSLLAQSSHRSFHAWWRHGVRGMKKKKQNNNKDMKPNYSSMPCGSTEKNDASQWIALQRCTDSVDSVHSLWLMGTTCTHHDDDGRDTALSAGCN